MGLLTAKLPDGDHAALRRLAEERGVSMAELIRQWIKAAPGIAPRDKSHQACDQRIAELEARLRAKPVTAVTEPGSMPGFEVNSPEGGTRGIGSTPSNTLRPAFLAAPDDDCAACGHDRHRWVTDGVCKAPVGKGTCGCTDFATREELTF